MLWHCRAVSDFLSPRWFPANESLEFDIHLNFEVSLLSEEKLDAECNGGIFHYDLHI